MSGTVKNVFRNPTLQEEVQHAVLPSGLRIFFCPKPGFQKKYACYSAYYGSVDRLFRGPGESQPAPVPDGIAHFLEHTLFETPQGNVSDLFSRNGAYNNAATSFSTTTYLFASGDRFYDNLGLLIDFVENPVFQPEKVEKEKGIIEQEIYRYRDDPGWVGYMGLLESLFQRHPIRIDIAGTPESIRRIDSETLHRCYRAFYHPRNMILFVIGDLESEAVFDFAARRSKARAGAARSWEIERSYPPEPAEVERERFEARMEVALPKFLLGFKEVGVPSSGREFLSRELATEFALDFLFSRASDAFQELYQAQLVLDDFSASYHACAGIGYVAVGGETPDPEGLQRRLEELIAGFRERGLATEDFERQKRKFMGGFIRCFNSLEFIASHYTYYRFHDLDLFEVIDTLAGLGKDLIEERIQNLFSPQGKAASVILPKN
ncbi:MAG: insulinase family protein [Planctomycetes bacterium]|nr:insulinase family protein [Planctomycetota bacterium]